ncbi:hypothetical protein D018_3915, partial [Vibrio parahaemolyticus VP2007-007]
LELCDRFFMSTICHNGLTHKTCSFFHSIFIDVDR